MKMKFYLCNIFAISCFCCFSQITNEGLLQIEPSTNVYFQNEYTNTDSGIHKCDGNLYLSHDFINDGATSSLSGTTYFKSSNNTLMTIHGTTNAINFYNLEIDVTAINTKGVAVADGFAIIVEQGLNLINGKFRLIGEAQLIQNSTSDFNSIVSGKLLVDQQGYASAYKFNYWSSPVNDDGTFSLSESKFDGTDSSINPFKPRVMLFNSGSPYNGLPSVLDEFGSVTTALTINNQWLYKYLQGTGSYSDWVSLDEYSTLNPGEGYTMKGTNTLFSEQNYVYSGVPNNGQYYLPINDEEQSLLGNPYPSALDANRFITDNLLLMDTLYFWVDGGSTSHALTNYLGGYATRNLTGGTPPSISSPLISGIGTSGSVAAPSQYVSIGQGFFVEAYDSGNITFNNSQRIFVTESSLESRLANNDIAETEIETVNQYIRIGYEDTEGFHRQLLLGFLPNSAADNNFNYGYDAQLIETRDDELFFIIENDLDKKYIIQGVNNFDDTIEFPLGILIANSGTHKIILDEVENFDHTVYLKDNVLNVTHNLSESNFDVNLAIGNHLDRYSIVFMPEETLSITNQTKEHIDIFYDGNSNVILNNIDRIHIKNVKIFNALGQQTLQVNTDLNNKERIEIPYTQSNGIYFVNVETNTNILTKKILTY